MGKKLFKNKKYMYFLDAKGVPTPFNFRIHHFGPYSSELDYQTDNLELAGAITVTENSSGFIITPGKKAEELVRQGNDFIEKNKEIIDEVLDLLPEDPKMLELWSTTHFVANSMIINFTAGQRKNG